MNLIILNRNRYTIVPAGSSTATMPPSTRSSDCPQYGRSTASNDSSAVDVSEDEVEAMARIVMMSGT